MVAVETLFVFVPMAVLLAVTPGAGMMFALGQGARSGPMSGIAAGLGAATGTLWHTMMAAVGLAAALQTHPFSFEIIRWAGVAYLAYLGVQALFSSSLVEKSRKRSMSGPLATWQQATLVNLLNPKVAIFVLALVPQFINEAEGSVFLQFLVLGTILSVVGGLVDASVGAAAGKIADRLRTRPAAGRLLSRLTGVIFLSLAAKLAFEKR